MPYFKDAYHEELDKSKWGLVEVAQLENYKGSIWATWDESAPPFQEYLGDFKMFLDLSLDSWDGSEGGSEIIGGVQKWLIPCNWKFPAENFSGDSYHNISHLSVDMVGIGPSAQGRRDTAERTQSRRLQVAFPDRGHQCGVHVLPANQPTPRAYLDAPVVSEYFRECEEKRRAKKGEWGRVTGSPGEIFPNTALHPRQPRTIAVWHPRGPHSGPGGLTEQDDMENWNYAHSASRGTIARRRPYNSEQGLDFEQHDFEYQGLKFPGVVMDITEAKSSEHNLRNFYRRWAEFMDAASWGELATWRGNQ